MYRFPSLEVSDTCYAPTLTGSPPSQPDSPRWEKRLSSADAAPAFDDGEREPAAFHVKAEPDETAGAFILERGTESLLPQIPCLTPITAPLRATHASKDMRKLMGVFRLDPFTVHNGVRGSPRAWQYGAEEEPGPLAEEPVMFEFQLELVHALDSPTPPESRSPTPASLKEEEPRCSAYRSSYFPAYAEPAKMDYDAHLLENMNPTAGVFATDGCLQGRYWLYGCTAYVTESLEQHTSLSTPPRTTKATAPKKRPAFPPTSPRSCRARTFRTPAPCPRTTDMRTRQRCAIPPLRARPRFEGIWCLPSFTSSTHTRPPTRRGSAGSRRAAACPASAGRWRDSSIPPMVFSVGQNRGTMFWLFRPAVGFLG